MKRKRALPKVFDFRGESRSGIVQRLRSQGSSIQSNRKAKDHAKLMAATSSCATGPTFACLQTLNPKP